jgi:DNA-binding NarL/FixJ family response regulator
MKSQDTPEKVLTGGQCKVLALLAGGASIEAAASCAKINSSTVHAWLKKESLRRKAQRNG